MPFDKNDDTMRKYLSDRFYAEQSSTSIYDRETTGTKAPIPADNANIKDENTVNLVVRALEF